LETKASEHIFGNEPKKPSSELLIKLLSQVNVLAFMLGALVFFVLISIILIWINFSLRSELK